MGSAAVGDMLVLRAPVAGAADGEDIAGAVVGAGALELDSDLASLQVLSQLRHGRHTMPMRGTPAGTILTLPMPTAAGPTPMPARQWLSVARFGVRGAGVAPGGNPSSRVACGDQRCSVSACASSLRDELRTLAQVQLRTTGIAFGWMAFESQQDSA